MYFTTGTKLLCSQPIIFAFFPCPKAEIEYYIRSQFKRPSCYVPKHSLDQTMPGIVFWLFCILTKETYMPLIGCQPKCRILPLKPSRERRFPRKGKSNHQMKGCQISYSCVS